MQLLEKALERERESVRKEKSLRQRDQKTFYDVAQKAVQVDIETQHTPVSHVDVEAVRLIIENQ